MSSMTVKSTKNYKLFTRSNDNRPTDVKRRKRLLESMQIYGFLPCYPIVCFRDQQGRLVVKDGQHRLTIAAELGLEIWYIIVQVDFDVALVNCTVDKWKPRDYAAVWVEKGKEDYQRGLDFAESHKLPVGTSFALLAGTVSFSNIQVAFKAGSFKVKDEEWADAVARIYKPTCKASADVRNARFLEACMGVCRVKEFSEQRFLANVKKCQHLLASYSNRDAYLTMMEEIYNYGRKQLVGLRSLATMALRERHPSNANKRPSKGAA